MAQNSRTQKMQMSVFVKNEHTETWPEMVVKCPIMSQFHFESEYKLKTTITRFMTSCINRCIKVRAVVL